MTSLIDSIQLASPLPWIDTLGHSGFVTALGKQELILTIYDQNMDIGTDLDIQVMFGASQSFPISGTIKQFSSKSLYLHVSDRSLETLNDLLGQVRKDQHIEICRSSDVESSDKFTGFQDVNFIPQAIPELDFSDLDTTVKLFTKEFAFPMLITGMTGGIEKGIEINRNLALAAQKFNIPMGVGSQRIALENPSYGPIFDVKKHAPRVFLIGNLGFAQLKQSNYLELCQRAVDMIDADALAIHVNVIQEAVQVEGDRHFKGIFKRLEHICSHIKKPIIIKEVGSGIAPDTAKKLRNIGASGIDIGGRGGTSWGYIEGLRSSRKETQALAQTFRNWGIPTAYALMAARKANNTLPIIATGGIRDGLMVAKAVALGANLVGIGLPLLRAAIAGQKQVEDLLSLYSRGLKIAMIATGSQSLNDLEQHIVLGHPLANSFQEQLSSKLYDREIPGS